MPLRFIIVYTLLNPIYTCRDQGSNIILLDIRQPAGFQSGWHRQPPSSSCDLTGNLDLNFIVRDSQLPPTQVPATFTNNSFNSPRIVELVGDLNSSPQQPESSLAADSVSTPLQLDTTESQSVPAAVHSPHLPSTTQNTETDYFGSDDILDMTSSQVLEVFDKEDKMNQKEDVTVPDRQ